MVVAGIFSDVTDWVDEISDHWWFLLVILAIAFLDSIIPVVPSETAVIIGGVAAGQGDQHLGLVIACGAVGAFLGDNAAYLIGRRFSGRIYRRAEHHAKTKARLEWGEHQIRERGGLLLVTARFVPGGRTVLTVSSGLTRQSHFWFARWVAVAVIIWASYAAILGRIFGQAFKDNHTLAFWLAFGTALAINALIEVIRHRRIARQKAEGSVPEDEFP